MFDVFSTYHSFFSLAQVGRGRWGPGLRERVGCRVYMMGGRAGRQSGWLRVHHRGLEARHGACICMKGPVIRLDSRAAARMRGSSGGWSRGMPEIGALTGNTSALHSRSPTPCYGKLLTPSASRIGELAGTMVP